MVGECDQNVFFIQIDALSFTEFKISEFEISRVDCIYCKVGTIGGAKIWCNIKSFILEGYKIAQFRHLGMGIATLDSHS